MDPAVGLVRAYLQLNGFFVMTEYPVLEEVPGGGYRPTTDLDVLAVRFNNTGHFVGGVGGAGEAGRVLRAADAALEVGRAELDFLIGEVKQGSAELNRGARDPRVLRAALVRFGAFNPATIDVIVQRLIDSGDTRSQSGWARVRLMAFGSTPPGRTAKGYSVMLHRHMVGYVRRAIESHADMLLAADLKDDSLATLALLSKSHAWDTVPTAHGDGGRS